MTTETRMALLFFVLAGFAAFNIGELMYEQHELKQARSGVISQDDLHWHPSKITCPDDKWDSQHGYTLVRIEGANGQEWCVPK